MLSLQGSVRCAEDADPSRTRGYKSAGAGISNSSCFTEVHRTPAIVPVDWRSSVLMGGAVGKPCPCGGLVSSGARGMFLVLLQEMYSFKVKIKIFVQPWGRSLQCQCHLGYLSARPGSRWALHPLLSVTRRGWVLDVTQGTGLTLKLLCYPGAAVCSDFPGGSRGMTLECHSCL